MVACLGMGDFLGSPILARPAVEAESVSRMQRAGAILERGLAEWHGRGAEPIACTLAP